MQSGMLACILILAGLVACNGCLTAEKPSPSPAHVVPAAVPTTAGRIVAAPISDLALQPGDLTQDYLLRDRHVVA